MSVMNGPVGRERFNLRNEVAVIGIGISATEIDGDGRKNIIRYFGITSMYYCPHILR